MKIQHALIAQTLLSAMVLTLAGTPTPSLAQGQPADPTPVRTPLTCPVEATCSEDNGVVVQLGHHTQMRSSDQLADLRVHVRNQDGQPIVGEDVTFILLNAANGEMFFVGNGQTDSAGVATAFGATPGITTEGAQTFALPQEGRYRWIVSAHNQELQIPEFTFPRPVLQPAPCAAGQVCSADNRLKATLDPRGLMRDDWRLGNISISLVDTQGNAQANTPVILELINAANDQVLSSQTRQTDAAGNTDLYNGQVNSDYVPQDGTSLYWQVKAAEATLRTRVYTRRAPTPATLEAIPAMTWSAGDEPSLTWAKAGHTYGAPTRILRVSEGAWADKHDSLAVTLASLKGKVGPGDIVEIQLQGALHHLPASIDLDGALLRIVGDGGADGPSELIRYTPNPEEHEVATVSVHSPLELVNVVIAPQNSPGAALALHAPAVLDKVVFKNRPLTFAEDRTPAFRWSQRITQAVDRAKNPLVMVRPSLSGAPVTVRITRSQSDHVGTIDVDGLNAQVVVDHGVFNTVPFSAAVAKIGAQTSLPSLFVHNQVDLSRGGHGLVLEAPNTVVSDLRVTGKDRLLSPELTAKINEAATSGPFVRTFERIKDLLGRLAQPTSVIWPGQADTNRIDSGSIQLTGGQVMPPLSQDRQADQIVPGPVAPGEVVPGLGVPGVPGGAGGSGGADGSVTPGGDGSHIGSNSQADVRIAGADRIETAIAINAARKITKPDTIYVASADNPADALAAGPLAAATHSPLYITWQDRVPEVLSQTLKATASPDTQIVLIGGPAALSPGVEAAMGEISPKVRRLAGANRAATAIAIAQELNHHQPVTKVIVADGQTWHAPILAGPLAIAHHSAILLSAGQSPAPETLAWLAANPKVKVSTTIGAASHAHQARLALRAQSPQALSLEVAKAMGPAITTVAIATATTAVDAMVAAPLVGAAPILLIDHQLTPDQAAWVKAHEPVTPTILGGVTAVPETWRP